MSHKDVLAGPVLAASTFYGKSGDPEYVLYTFGRVERGTALAEGDVAERIRKMSKGNCPVVVSGRYESRPLPVGGGIFEQREVLIVENATLLNQEAA